MALKQIRILLPPEHFFVLTHWCSLMSPFVVHGLKHAFPGRLLHHTGGEETAENTQFTLPERLCGPARPPYSCQKLMGAMQPQREMKSWWRIYDKWMHWINSGYKEEVVCAGVNVCVWLLPSYWIYFHLKWCPLISPVKESEKLYKGMVDLGLDGC